MNIIGCLDVPTSGTYELDGKNLKDLSDDDLADIRNRHIGFVFQHFHLLPKMTALDNVALPLLYADVPLKERRERAAEALTAVGLAERMDFYPNQLSGGQCQRVAIARAMVGKPDLLLADEPTGALDTKSGNQIMEIFRQLSADGMTIVMITHEPSIADCADKTYRILDGELFTGEMGGGTYVRETP
jgi:putative ABC transport system ATP-binding protein